MSCYFSKPKRLLFHFTVFQKCQCLKNGLDENMNHVYKTLISQMKLQMTKLKLTKTPSLNQRARNLTGLRSPANAIEPFYAVEVNDKGIANENTSDSFDHNILAGDKSAEVFYLQHHEEEKNMIKYQQPKEQQSVYICVAEVFAMNIVSDADLKMSVKEYQSILDNAS